MAAACSLRQQLPVPSTLPEHQNPTDEACLLPCQHKIALLAAKLIFGKTDQTFRSEKKDRFCPICREGIVGYIPIKDSPKINCIIEFDHSVALDKSKKDVREIKLKNISECIFDEITILIFPDNDIKINVFFSSENKEKIEKIFRDFGIYLNGLNYYFTKEPQDISNLLNVFSKYLILSEKDFAKIDEIKKHSIKTPLNVKDLLQMMKKNKTSNIPE